MKKCVFFMALISLVTLSAFAGETTTECLMMKEQNERNNPKANLNSLKPKTKTKSAGAVAQ